MGKKERGGGRVTWRKSRKSSAQKSSVGLLMALGNGDADFSVMGDPANMSAGGLKKVLRELGSSVRDDKGLLGGRARKKGRGGRQGRGTRKNELKLRGVHSRLLSGLGS